MTEEAGARAAFRKLQGKPGQSPRTGPPSNVLLLHLLYQESRDAVRDVALRQRHAGWFAFIIADGDGRLLNFEGAPEGIEVVDSQRRPVRVAFGTRSRGMTRASDTPLSKEIPPSKERCWLTEESPRQNS